MNDEATQLGEDIKSTFRDLSDGYDYPDLRTAIDRLVAMAQGAETLDSMRTVLEIIAVGDARNPQAQAAEELIALGYWRDTPEARCAAPQDPQAAAAMVGRE